MPLPLDFKQESHSTISEITEEKQVYHNHDYLHAKLRIICAGHTRGKTAENCEDAFYISGRSFGVADGVSGWNDFGFSSQEFATQLMTFSKAEVEEFDTTSPEKHEEKKEL